MILDHITPLHIWHCNTQNHDKVWGWFVHGDLMWAFWGGMGKAWSFKLHGETSWAIFELDKLAGEKARKGYAPMPMDTLNILDPTWQLRFNERFTYFLLQQSVG